MFVFAIEWSWLWTKIGTYKIRFDKVNLEEKEGTIEKLVKIHPIVNKIVRNIQNSCCHTKLRRKRRHYWKDGQNSSYCEQKWSGTYKIRFAELNLEEEKEGIIEKMVKIRPIVNTYIVRNI